VHNELCTSTLFVRPDYTLALGGLWGAFGPEKVVDDDGEDRFVPEPEYMIPHLLQYPGTKGFKSDVFDWATVVWGFMRDGEAPLGAVQRQEGSMAVVHAVGRGEFPALEEERLGGFVGKAWRGEFESVAGLMEEVGAWLEGKGFKVREGDVVGVEVGWLEGSS